MIDRELNNVLNTGEIIEMHLGGTTVEDSVVKKAVLNSGEITEIHLGGTSEGNKVVKQNEVSTQVNTILNTGEITEIHLGGITPADKVVKQSELSTEINTVLNTGEITEIHLGGTALGDKVLKQDQLTPQMDIVLNSGIITEIHLGGTLPADKVVKQSELPVPPRLEVGFVDYNDLATATTPISIPGTSIFIDLANDGAGPFTIKTYLPSGVTDVWNATTNLFDWSELALGDMIDIRCGIVVTTTSVNQEVELSLQLATNGIPYEIPYAHLSFKTVGTYQINLFNGIYLGDLNTKDNGGKFRLKSDSAATVKVNGWYCKITKK